MVKFFLVGVKGSVGSCTEFLPAGPEDEDLVVDNTRILGMDNDGKKLIETVYGLPDIFHDMGYNRLIITSMVDCDTSVEERTHGEFVYDLSKKNYRRVFATESTYSYALRYEQPSVYNELLFVRGPKVDRPNQVNFYLCQ